MKALALKAALFALPVAMACASAAPALAWDFKPEVAVPTASNDISGCWSADRTLYGAYQLSFCLDRGAGSYYVTGGGIDCQADVSWRKTWPGGYKFVMSRASCGNGTDWTGDTFKCKLERVVYGVGAAGNGFSPKVAVPTPGPAGYALSCSYRPAIAGWGWQTFKAYRG
jgi:hypothetical protein